MKTEKTFLQLQMFNIASSKYLENNKEDTKFKSAIKNILKQVQKKFEEFNEKSEEINIDHCSVDEKTKVILKGENGNFQYTKEALKERNKELKELLKSKVEIHQRIIEDVNVFSERLTDEEKECFAGFVIPEINEEEITA